jgi:hypothetical protein
LVAVVPALAFAFDSSKEALRFRAGSKNEEEGEDETDAEGEMDGGDEDWLFEETAPTDDVEDDNEEGADADGIYDD